jgi:hypothetical protein
MHGKTWITHSRNTLEKTTTLIGNVPWNLSRPNVALKPLKGQWKILALPQVDPQT